MIKTFPNYINKIVAFLFLIQILSCYTFPNETFKTTEIKSKQVDEKLFIKTANWGLTGENQTTVITLSNDTDFDKKQSDDYYVFSGLEPFFYRQANDSLILYSRTKVNVPKRFKTRWKIVQYIVDNPSFMRLYKDSIFKSP